MTEDITTAVQDRDIIDLIKENILQDKKRETEYTNLLKDYIYFLKDEITHKNKFICKQLNIIYKREVVETGPPNRNNVFSSNDLFNVNDTSLSPNEVGRVTISDDNSDISDILYPNYEKDDVCSNNIPAIDNKWITERRKNKKSQNIINSSLNEFESLNNYNLLVDHEKELIDTDEPNKAETVEDRNNNYNATIKSRVYVNEFPERDVLPTKRTVNVVTQNKKYAERKKKMTKSVIISDSITKRINMIKLNNRLENGNALKRAFPGATASQLNHYVQATIKEDKPDTIIICAGTNNLTKKKQSVQDTSMEIIDIVETCRRGGVQTIFISSLTCRPSYQREINEINNLLKYYADIYNFTFIDNVRIRKEHLWKDGVHLNDEGISILTNNYITHLNRPSLARFHSIWD